VGGFACTQEYVLLRLRGCTFLPPAPHPQAALARTVRMVSPSCTSTTPNSLPRSSSGAEQRKQWDSWAPSSACSRWELGGEVLWGWYHQC